MKKLVKRILGVIVIASIMFSAMPGINVSAITGYRLSSMISPCPYCKVRNISYCVMRDFSGTSQTFHEGKYCEVCKRTVLSGESHYCYTVQDRFSFMCDKCHSDYYVLSDPILAEHTIKRK